MTGNLLLTFLLVISSLLFADAHGQSDSLKAHSKAEELEQTGRDFFSKGDFTDAIRYLELSRQEYERLGKRSESAKNLQNIGLAYLMLSDFNQAQICLLQAEIEFVALDDKNHLAYCLTNLGLVHYYKGDYPDALDYYKKASEIYKEIHNPEEYAELINRIGMTYWSLGIHDKALQYLHEFIRLLDDDRPKALAIGYNNLGAIYKELDKDENALEFYRNAVYYYKIAEDSLDLPSPLTNIGTIYSSNDILDSALFYYEKALLISIAMGDRLQTVKTKHNVALIYERTGRSEEAAALLQEFLQTSEELGYREGVVQARLSLANLARNLKDTERAKAYYRQCIVEAESIKLSSVLMIAHRCLSEILLEDHLYKEALFHFQKYTGIKDTIFNKEKARIITELETRFETEKKEQENAILVKENELKDEKISDLYLIIAGTGILAIAAVLLIFLYRRNALNKKRLAESEAARLAEKVEYQNKELASSALAMSRNLSFIRNLLTELKALSSHVDLEGLGTVKSISRSIQRLDNDPAWEEFELRFHEVHNRFYDNLVNQFPSLTTNEVRLCALLKLGMNTKEISSVTFQNVRAIETARLRLRKKLGMESTEDLGSFLRKF